MSFDKWKHYLSREPYVKLPGFSSYKTQSIMAAGLLFFWCLVLVITCLLSFKIVSIANEEAEFNLSGISDGVAAIINTRIRNHFSILDSIGSSWFQLLEYPQVASLYLQTKAKFHGFDRITITDREKRTVCSSGENLNYTERPHIIEAFKGKNSFVRVHKSPIDGTDGVLYVQPIYADEAVVGVITGWNKLESFKKIIKSNVFGGHAVAHIVDALGNVIIAYPGKHAFSDQANCFGVLLNLGVKQKVVHQMAERMKHGEPGLIYFNDSVLKSLQYAPFIDNLYLLTVVPTPLLKAKVREFLTQTFVVVGSLLAVFTVLLCLIFFLMKQSTAKLARVIFVDPVTDGMSLVRFQMEIMPKISSAPQGNYAILSINIKQFKIVNDVFGVDTGDALLHYLHKSILDRLEKDELVCRDISDNFLVFLVVKPKEKLLSIMNSIAEDLNEWISSIRKGFVVKISIGVYAIEDISLSFLGLAGRAYYARRHAKITIHHKFYDCGFYSDMERLQLLKAKDMENKMRDALNHHDFIIYLQPKIELESSSIVGAEALVRWQDPDKGLIPPAEFIPLFESNGFILELDLYVFEEVCRSLRTWLDRGLTPVPISVNFSRFHLIDSLVVEKYTCIRNRYELPCGLIEIELTESMAIDNPNKFITLINELKESGFVCSLDDFGCGYSSLNLLKDADIDILKLDGGFWSVKEDNQREKDIITAIVQLAKKLGVKTVSEGVETATQLKFLREIHCEMVQGYIFSKPVPLDVFEDMVFGQGVTQYKDRDPLLGATYT